MEPREKSEHAVPGDLLWDVRHGEVSWDQHREFLVKRILCAGTVEQIKMLRRKAGDQYLREHLMRTHGRCIDPRKLRYLETILDLPHDLVSSWLTDPRRQVWDNR